MEALPQASICRVVWSGEVYEPSDDSFALVDAVHAWLAQLGSGKLPSVCLEVGCGSGYVICSLALALQALHGRQHGGSSNSRGGGAAKVAAPAAATLLATDLSDAAIAATSQTLAAHHVGGVELVRTDLVAGLLPRLAGAVDLLLFNPPYVPTPDEEVERQGIARAWAGGHLGRRVTDRLLAQLPELLSLRGHAFIVTVPENKPQEMIKLLAAAGFSAAIVLTRAADEECLQILHVQRQQPAAAAEG